MGSNAKHIIHASFRINLIDTICLLNLSLNCEIEQRTTENKRNSSGICQEKNFKAVETCLFKVVRGNVVLVAYADVSKTFRIVLAFFGEKEVNFIQHYVVVVSSSWCTSTTRTTPPPLRSGPALARTVVV